jgi:hypothetical protein
MRMGLDLESFERRILLTVPPIVANIDSLGFGAQNGTIGELGDVDVFQYNAPVNQTLDIRVTAMSPLESATLAILSKSGQQLLSAPGEINQATTEVRFVVVAGSTYFVDVSAGAASFPQNQIGPFRLVFADFSDQQSNAYPLVLPPGSTSVTQAGVIDPAGDVDWFSVTSPLSGLLSATVAAGSGAALEGQVLVQDSSGRHSVTDQRAATGAAQSEVTGFQVEQGQTYSIQVAAAQSAPEAYQSGRYMLTVSFEAFSAGHNLTTATLLAVAPEGSAAQNSTLTTPGVADYYKYVAPLSTEIVVRDETPSFSDLDSILTVYNSAGIVLPDGTSNNAQWIDRQGMLETGSEVRVAVTAGQAYYIKAGAFLSSTGDYDLSVIPDNTGDSLASAVPVVLAPDGSLNTPGFIVFPGDVVFYRLVATENGDMSIQQDAVGRSLDAFLTILDSSGHLITFDDDSDPSITGFYENSLVQFPVVAGQTYYAEAAAYPNVDGTGLTGGYTLKISTRANPPPSDAPDTFPRAAVVDFSSGYLHLTGTINSDAEVNIFKFVAPATESIQIELDPSAANNFQGYLYAFDDELNQVANDYNLSLLQNEKTSIISFNIVQDQTYYVQVASYIGRIGQYDLRFAEGPLLRPTTSSGGKTFTTAIPLQLDSAQTATVYGTIDEPGGANIYQFQATATTTLTMRQFAAPGSRLDTYLIAFSDSDAVIVENDDMDVTVNQYGEANLVINRDSEIALDVIAGKTYYLKAASAGSSTGAYYLAISPAHSEFGDRIGDVYPSRDPRNPIQPVAVKQIRLSPSADGQYAATQTGTINSAGDLDAFQFTAPASGLITVTEEAAPGSNLDTYLYAFDSSREPLANNNDFDGTYNSLVQFNVAAGQVYYLKAAAYRVSIGAYVLKLMSEPPNSALPGHSFATATQLKVPATGPTVVNGQIASAGEADVYEFVAPASGLVTVTQDAAPNNPLDSYLYAYDGSQGVNNFDGLQDLIASDDDSGGTLNSLIQFDVTQGNPYFLRAAAFGTSVGNYILTITYGQSTTAITPGHTFGTATPITLATSGYGSQLGMITAPLDVDFYQFLAPYTGTITILEDVPSAGTSTDGTSSSKSMLDGLLSVYDSTAALIAQDVGDAANNTPNSQVTVSIVKGQTYDVEAAGYGDTTGRYDLLFNADAPNTFTDASLITIDSKLLSATVFGAIEVPQEVDFYRFVAPVTGPIDVTEEAAGTSTLDSYLFLFNDSQTLIGSDNDTIIDPTGPGGGVTIPDSLVQSNVVAGQTYYIEGASAIGLATDPGRSATGAYRLEITFPAYDFGETFADAVTIAPPAPAVATQQGNVLQIGEVDMFQFAAAVSGTVEIDFAAPPGSAGMLDPILIANENVGPIAYAPSGIPYNPSGTEIARDATTLFIGVHAGSLYFVQVGGYGDSTGRFEIEYSETPGSGRGVDLGSALSLALTDSGAATVNGSPSPLGVPDVYQFQATVTGQATVTLTTSAVANLAAFTCANGTPTQVAGDAADPGVMTFAVSQGQTYFVRVAPTGSGGAFVLVLQTTAAAAPTNLAVPGKDTLVQLGHSYVSSVPAVGPSSKQAMLAANLITSELVRAFLDNQTSRLSQPYVLVWTDPVDFLLQDTASRQEGYTAARGTVSEVSGSYNSGAGVLKLVILPMLSNVYDLNLYGLGEGSVLYGAAEITTSGGLVEPETTTEQPVTVPGGGLTIVLGFELSDKPPVPPPPPPAPPSANSSSTEPELTSASNVFLAGALAQVFVVVGDPAAVAVTSTTAAPSVAPVPSNVTSLVAPPSLIGAFLSEHYHDELPAPMNPNVFDHDGPPIIVALQSALARSGLKELGAWIAPVVQPVVRGLDSLGGRPWSILRSIYSNLTRPRIAVKGAGITGAFLDQPGTFLPGIVALSAPAREEPLDLLLEEHRQGTEPSPEPVSDENGTDGSGDVQLELMAVALLVTAVADWSFAKSA